jgi:hypothetical protein
MSTPNPKIPPASDRDFTSPAWQRFFNDLLRRVVNTSAIAWSILDKVGSNLTDIVTRNHNDLQNIQGGTTNHWHTPSDISLPDGSSLVGFLRTGTGAVARTLQDRGQDVVSVFDFMTNAQIADVRSGTALVDVVIPLKAAIDYITANKLVLYMPPGTYKITNQIEFTSASSDWAIVGFGARILQASNNLPIFNFSAAGIYRFSILGIYFDYATQQPIANTLAVAIYVNNLTGIGGVYLFEIAWCTFNNAYRGIATNPSTAAGVTCIFWGGNLHDLLFNATMTGSSISCRSNQPGGAPNNRVNQIYIRADSIDASEIILDFNACDSISIDNIEINVVSNGSRVLATSGGTSGVIGTFRVEIGTFTGASFDHMFSIGSNIVIHNIELLTLTFNTGAVNYKILKNTGGAITVKIHIGIFDLRSATITSGNIFILGTQAQWIIDHYAVPAGSGVLLGDAAGDVAVFTDLNEVSGTVTLTLTGCTTAPTLAFNYVKKGKLVSLTPLAAQVAGTSNAVTKTLTGLPTYLAPVAVFYLPYAASDNGGAAIPAVFSVGLGGVITLYTNYIATPWTNAGVATAYLPSITYLSA